MKLFKANVTVMAPCRYFSLISLIRPYDWTVFCSSFFESDVSIFFFSEIISFGKICQNPVNLVRQWVNAL